MRRITPPSIKERPSAYVRTPMDFKKYDHIGRGFFYEDVDDFREYYGPSLPLSLNGSICEDFQILPRIATSELLSSWN